MFGPDPAKSLAKARRLLDEGDAPAALRLAQKAQARARPPLSGELADLAEEARRALLSHAAERAVASASEGYFEDAAEWLRGALDHAEAGGERERIEARIGELEDAAEAAARRTQSEVARRETEDEGRVRIVDGEPVLALDSEEPLPPEEALYHSFVESLREDVGRLYVDRPPEFRRSIVELADHDAPEEAQAAIEAMAAADPDDPLLRFERGRWRLLRGDAAGARPDLEAAWAAFGDRPLDLGGSLSIPAIWAEAALAAGDHAAVLERLEDRGELTLGDAGLCRFYARALLAAGEDEAARSFLAESLEHFPRDHDLSWLLATTLQRGGDGAAAAQVLETAIRACGRNCAPTALHPPSLHLLAAIYAEAGEPVERLGDVLLLLRAAQGGELGPGDWLLQARYHELTGEPRLAAKARARAGAQIEPAAGDQQPPAPAYEPG